MDVILDIQGFKSADNEFVLKELSAVTIQRNPGDASLSTSSSSSSSRPLQEIWSYVFAPPYAWSNLSPKYKSMNSWLIHNYHGLPWGIGDTAYIDRKKILADIIKDRCYIYVKGSDKKKWIEDILGCSQPIIDLENLKCSSLKIMKIPHNCIIHKNYSVITKYSCACENVQALKLWFLEHSGMSTLSLTRSLHLYSQLKNLVEMAPEDIAEFPKSFFTIFHSNIIEDIWGKLPKYLQSDEEMLGYRRCIKHLEKNHGLKILRKNCIYCTYFDD